jgi:hypothetical protein
VAHAGEASGHEHSCNICMSLQCVWCRLGVRNHLTMAWHRRRRPKTYEASRHLSLGNLKEKGLAQVSGARKFRQHSIIEAVALVVGILYPVRTFLESSMFERKAFYSVQALSLCTHTCIYFSFHHAVVPSRSVRGCALSAVRSGASGGISCDCIMRRTTSTFPSLAAFNKS